MCFFLPDRLRNSTCVHLYIVKWSSPLFLQFVDNQVQSRKKIHVWASHIIIIVTPAMVAGQK